MEAILLGIYAFFVWLIFIKFKWLPWNIVSQVIVATIPIIGITILILRLNIFAPSSADVRVMNYVVPINPRVAGKVIEVPVQPNLPVRKGDVLFRIVPQPFEIQETSPMKPLHRTFATAAALLCALAFIAPMALCALVMWIAAPPEQRREFFRDLEDN